MRSNYKKSGNYIRQIDIRNTEEKTDNLLGVSVTKKFIPSIANTVGTDFSKYKIVKKHQFTYIPDTSRRGDKIGLALLEHLDKALVSQAYTVFEIIDKNELDPEYLMMWFTRPEFDRYARYMSHGSVREIFGWDEMCDVELPVPSIEKQREIVKEYNTIVNRIKLNEQLNQKLEETAQAIYKQWFVDFEFPNKERKPYKSSGGEMVYNEELQQEIPKEWGITSIESISKDIVCGKTPSTLIEDNFGNSMSFLTIPDMHNKVFAGKTERSLSLKGVNTQKNKTLPANSLCVSCIGTSGLVVLTTEECQTNQQINSVICKDNISYYYMYFGLKALENIIREWGAKGSVGANLNKSEFSAIKILLPALTYLPIFHDLVEPFFNNMKSYHKEKYLLENMQELLLSSMASKQLEAVV